MAAKRVSAAHDSDGGTKASGGTKHDGGKLPYDLLPYDALAYMAQVMNVTMVQLPWRALREVVAVLQFGANKYAPHNWEKGINHSRTFAAAMRHMVREYLLGVRFDAETKLHPLAHAACEIMFALAFEVRSCDLAGKSRSPQDDRPTAEWPLDWSSIATGHFAIAVEHLCVWWQDSRGSQNSTRVLASALWHTLKHLEDEPEKVQVEAEPDVNVIPVLS